MDQFPADWTAHTIIHEFNKLCIGDKEGTRERLAIKRKIIWDFFHEGLKIPFSSPFNEPIKFEGSFPCLIPIRDPPTKLEYEVLNRELGLIGLALVRPFQWDADGLPVKNGMPCGHGFVVGTLAFANSLLPRIPPQM